jgi:hypothetical protein
MQETFAHMRPFLEEEVPAAIQTLLESLDWSAQLTPFIGDQASAQILEGIAKIQSVQEFQSEVSKPFVQLVLDKQPMKSHFLFRKTLILMERCSFQITVTLFWIRRSSTWAYCR